MIWKEWKTIKKGDYLYAKIPQHPKANKNGYVLEHRVVMENKIGRLLLENEEVHHIDENRHNNSPENLEIMIRGEHQRFHGKINGLKTMKHGRSRYKKGCRCPICRKSNADKMMRTRKRKIII